MCQVSCPQLVHDGTTCQARSPRPGVADEKAGVHDGDELAYAIDALQSQAEIFAWRYLNDARARHAYVSRIHRASQELRSDVLSGRLSAAEASRVAQAARNTIMEETRAITSAIGRARATGVKSQGLSYDEALNKSVRKLFPGKTFAELGAAQKRQVFLEVVEASGRSNPQFTSKIPKWTRFGRGLVVVTVAISVVNIWQAENKLKQGLQEGDLARWRPRRRRGQRLGRPALRTRRAGVRHRPVRDRRYCRRPDGQHRRTTHPGRGRGRGMAR